jgi:hypothetical protein
VQKKSKTQLDTQKRRRRRTRLTCLAMPKSASLTTPDESTSKLAPLMSLWNKGGKNQADKKKMTGGILCVIKKISPNTTSKLNKCIKVSHS